jgi:FkbM family methyltransferase
MLSVIDPRQPLVHSVHERFIREWVKSDSIVWDIGANLGLFSLPAALKATAGRVYAFEPDVDLACNLLRSSRLPRNRTLKMDIFCLAVSDADGVNTFEISKFGRAMNRLQATGKWNEVQITAEETRWVSTLRIDTLAKTLAPPSVIKIDVEGAEMTVLEGGESTISTCRPIILVEGPKALWERMWNFFERHHYALFDGEAAGRSRLTHPIWNTIAIPEEKLDSP